MPEIFRPSGLRIAFPDTYSVNTAAVDLAAPYIAKRSLKDREGKQKLESVAIRTGDFPNEKSAILEALEKQEMQLVDSIEFEPKLEPTPVTGVRRRSAPVVPEKQKTTLEIDVRPIEEAALLIEQDGVYSWVLPSVRADIPTPAARRGDTAQSTRRVTFSIDAYATSTPERRKDRRGFFTDLIYSKVKVFVLKFVARIIVGPLMTFLERNISRGLVLVNSQDLNQWQCVEDISTIPLPEDRAPKVLLLVHGTFSSTAGSFGELSSTPWGREFLAALLSNYDVVIGFNHPTLSEDPLTNAVDLLRRLECRSWTYAPQIDSIAFSRGALVLRSLVEHLLPSTNWPARFERAVFVGSTNGGTALAEPDNWHAFIDLYTNLATATARAIGQMPQATVPMTILSELLQGLGALVKYMASEVVTEDGVPGLAAMEPDGEFITTINQTQPGQPTPEKTWYYAITSEFKVRILDGEYEPKELPRRLVLTLADKFVDQLMKDAPNDLVVDTASMTEIDPQAGKFVRDTLDFGASPQVYHLNYFTRPEVVNALTRWLQLNAPVVSPELERRNGPSLKPLPNSTQAGINLDEIPAKVDTDILVTDINTPVKDALMEWQTKVPSYVVMRSPRNNIGMGGNFNYAVPTEEVLEKLGEHFDKAGTLGDMLELGEEDRADAWSVASARFKNIGSKSGHIGVVHTSGEPVGVISTKRSLPGTESLVKTAKRILQPSKPEDYIVARWAMPTFMPEPSAHQEHEPAKAPTTQCHFRAEMEEEVLLKHTTTVEVTVAREVIGGITHAAAKESPAAGVPVDPSRKILIQIIPKRNFEIVGEEDRVEIDSPEEGKPETFFFDIRATHDDGGEGELWVIARQGQVPLVRLTLTPRIVTKRSTSMHRVATEAKSAEARPLSGPLTQLFITEQINGSELRYRYQLQNPMLGLLAGDISKPIVGNREQYVKKLYAAIEERWVSDNKKDIDNFYQDLRAYGAELYNELVPYSIQEALWEHQNKIDSIMVIADEPFIPWEILHLVEPGKPLAQSTRFFGEMGLVRWLEEAGWPKEIIPLGEGRARYVIPDYLDPELKLPETLKEAKFLEKKLNAQPIEPTSAAVRAQLSTPSSFDLLHFAGHGEAENDNSTDASLLLQGRLGNGGYVKDFFNATTAMYHSNFHLDGKPGPMIVLNACQVGRARYKLTGTGGFAQAFLRRGASAFVGTLWSVGDSPARTFTEEFYSELKDNKATIAEATKRARAKAQEAGDATWLAYVVYAHPHAQLL